MLILMESIEEGSQYVENKIWGTKNIDSFMHNEKWIIFVIIVSLVSTMVMKNPFKPFHMKISLNINSSKTNTKDIIYVYSMLNSLTDITNVRLCVREREGVEGGCVHEGGYKIEIHDISAIYNLRLSIIIRMHLNYLLTLRVIFI